VVASKVELVLASPAHVGTIANRMRPMDALECRASGHTPRQALRLGLRSSALCYTAKVDGRPEAMFGLVVTSALSGAGTPWLLGTETVYRNGRAMMRLGPRILSAMTDSTPNLTNLVAVANAPALRFLRRLGFSIGEEVILTAGVEMVPFHLP
jgi:hypothetical protein